MLRCPTEVTPFLSEILALSSGIVSFDPVRFSDCCSYVLSRSSFLSTTQNFAEDDDEEDEQMEDAEEEEEEDDELVDEECGLSHVSIPRNMVLTLLSQVR